MKNLKISMMFRNLLGTEFPKEVATEQANLYKGLYTENIGILKNLLNVNFS